MPEWVIPMITVLGPLSLGILAWLATRKTSERTRIDNLEKRADITEGRNAKLQDYVGVLRKHIHEGNPPPPPPFPDDLFD